jgi:pimeloyl-ACP methyl ester carboxylesterase
MPRVVILLLLVLTGCADRVLLHPSTQPATVGAAQRRTLTRDGKTIELFTEQSPGAKSRGGPEAYSLEFTGNATRAEYVVDSIARHFGDRPVEVWVMNYPGFGGSTGPANLHDIPADSLATYDALAKEADGKPILICGNSLGTCAALYVASQRPAAGLSLQDPPPLQAEIMQGYGLWTMPFIAQIPGELNSLENAPKVHAPAVFVLAGQDKTVPPRFAQMVVDAYAGEKHLVRIPNAGHNSAIEGDALVQFQRELDWIWTKISK